jgi:hypothetical protein
MKLFILFTFCFLAEIQSQRFSSSHNCSEVNSVLDNYCNENTNNNNNNNNKNNNNENTNNNNNNDNNNNNTTTNNNNNNNENTNNNNNNASFQKCKHLISNFCFVEISNDSPTCDDLKKCVEGFVNSHPKNSQKSHFETITPRNNNQVLSAQDEKNDQVVSAQDEKNDQVVSAQEENYDSIGSAPSEMNYPIEETNDERNDQVLSAHGEINETIASKQDEVKYLSKSESNYTIGSAQDLIKPDENYTLGSAQPLSHSIIRSALAYNNTMMPSQASSAHSVKAAFTAVILIAITFAIQ